MRSSETIRVCLFAGALVGCASDSIPTPQPPLSDADATSLPDHVGTPTSPAIDGAVDATPTADGGSPPATTIKTPGMGASACAMAAPPAVFALSSGSQVPTSGPYVVLTGTLPPSVSGSAVAAVEVGGSGRGVRFDTARGVWSYLLAASASGDLTITARSASGSMAAPLLTHVTLSPMSAAPGRDLAAGQHTVGTWMFSWFTGDTAWRCNSAWQPPGGFNTWNGSAAWAREQLLDQMDAHLDAVGLQLDTASGTGIEGYRFTNVVHVVEAARGLLEEGVAPPRLFPFVDTAIVAAHWLKAQAVTLDLSTPAGRTYFYGHIQAYYQAANTALGSAFGAAGTARWMGGHPAVAFWHSMAMNGVDNAAVLDLKARFMTDFGASPYFIAHPNSWRNFVAVDEITQMVGPATHYMMAGRDGSGAPTINIEAGFWNPTSNTFYLPRAGGANFDAAWMSAQAGRATARHIWIDTWNETGEGSGMFAASPVTYTATDRGPCNSFANLHADSWGPDSRHYIDVTRAQASVWNDAGDLDATPLASDAPMSMHPGERRFITVVMQNAGNSPWKAGRAALGLTAASAADDFHLEAAVEAAGDALTARFGGVARGLPGVFTALVTAPCAPGMHTLSMQMIDLTRGAFGKAFSQTIAVAP
jgi:hypothetical protein